MPSVKQRLKNQKRTRDHGHWHDDGVSCSGVGRLPALGAVDGISFHLVEFAKDLAATELDDVAAVLLAAADGRDV